MREITLYANESRLVTSNGAPLARGHHPLVQWREKVAFHVRLLNGLFAKGTYLYAFDTDRDFLHTGPCNAGECTVKNGVISFDVIFNSARQASANSILFPNNP